MFVNAYIGAPLESGAAEQDNRFQFLLENIDEGKFRIMNSLNKRFLNINKMKDEKPLTMSNTQPMSISEPEIGDMFQVSIASLVGKQVKVTYDLVTLNPRIMVDYNEVGDKKHYTQIYFTIDTESFIPLIYDFPENAEVKEIFHFDKKFIGFLVEVEDKFIDTESRNTINIYGYDNRVEKTHEMAAYRMYTISTYMQSLTEEEKEEAISCIKDLDVYSEFFKNMIEAKETGITKENRKTFFKLRTMWQKDQKPRVPHLNGKLFTKYFIGTMPYKEAKPLIEKAMEVNGIPKKFKISYEEIHCVENTDESTLKKWVAEKLEYLSKEKRVRAITIVGDDLKINFKEAKKAKMKCVFHLESDGTIHQRILNC